MWQLFHGSLAKEEMNLIEKTSDEQVDSLTRFSELNTNNADRICQDNHQNNNQMHVSSEQTLESRLSPAIHSETRVEASDAVRMYASGDESYDVYDIERHNFQNLSSSDVEKIELDSNQFYRKRSGIVDIQNEYIALDSNAHNNSSEQPSEDVDGSRASKSIKPKSEPIYPGVPAAYAKYVFDPPKSPRLCSPSRMKDGSTQDLTGSGVTESNSSCIFVTLSSGRMYAVRFSTQNVTLSPLYVDKRYSAAMENDKKVQPDNVQIAGSPRTNNLAAHVLRSNYEISEHSSRPKSKISLPPLRVYTGTIPPHRRRANSEPPKTPTVGYINLLYKDMLLKVRVPVFPVARMKPPVSEDIIKQMEHLGMPTSESRKNKATVVVRCGSDLLQFKFDMVGVSVDYVEVQNSTAVQTEDKMVYIRERSLVTGRMLLLALPESTYFYRDPMEQIHRLHSQLQHSNVMPLWKYQMMKARLADRQGSTQFEEKLNKIYQQTRGSRFFFEGLDSLISAHTGLLCCEVINGEDIYEDMMLEYQGQRPQRKRMPQFLKQRSERSVETPNVSKPEMSESRETLSVGGENDTDVGDKT